MRVNLDIKDGIIHGWQSYPLDETQPVYEIDEVMLDKITNNLGRIDINFHVLNTEDNIKRERILELKSLLASTDYMAIKYGEGAISEYDYIDTRKIRQAWRDEINKLESELNGNSSTNK